jgi:hypothetical protein
MKKLLSIGAAAALAVALSLSSASPSSADPAGAAIAGGVLGFMAGAAAAGAGPAYHYNDRDFGRWRVYGGHWGYRDDFGWRRHIRDCFAAYGRSYDPRTDSYIGRNGYPRRCRL